MKKYLTIMGLLGLAACSGVPSNIDGDHVFYAFDSAVITDEAREALKDQALYMKKNPTHNVVVEGRCDERGTVEYNLALGALRAGNAAHVLIRNDIEPERITKKRI